METETNECVRQLRKRPDTSKDTALAAKVHKTNVQNQSNKSVNLLEKYFPFFIEQQMLLNELRKTVRESQTKQPPKDTHSSDESTHSQQDGDQDQIESNTASSPDVETGNEINCEFVEDNSESTDDALFQCEIIHSGNDGGSMEAEIADQHTNSSTRECSVEKNLSSTGTPYVLVGDHMDSEEFPLSSINDIIYDTIVSESSQSSEEVWECNFAENDTSLVYSDDAIDCELSREDCIDRFPEDSIEYNILYVSENANNNTKHTNLNRYSPSIFSDLSSDTYHFSDSDSSYPSFSELELQGQTTSLSSQENIPKIPRKRNINTQRNETADIPLFPCEFCSSHFNTSADLECHLNTHRGTELILPSPKTPKITPKKYIDKSLTTPNYHCTVCYRSYFSANGLKYHLKNQKCNDRKSNKTLKKRNLEQFISETTPHARPKYKCFYCSKTFISKHAWWNHLTQHQTNKQLYSCPECKFRVWHQNIIIYHLKEKHRTFFNSHILDVKQNVRDSAVPPLSQSQLRSVQLAERFQHKIKVNRKNNNKGKSYKANVIESHNKPNHTSNETFVTELTSIEEMSLNTETDKILSKLRTLKDSILSTNPDDKSNEEKVYPFFSVCIYCKKYFRNKDICSHLFTHVDIKKTLFSCPFCSLAYKTPKCFVKHYLKAHISKILSPQEL